MRTWYITWSGSIADINSTFPADTFNSTLTLWKPPPGTPLPSNDSEPRLVFQPTPGSSSIKDKPFKHWGDPYPFQYNTDGMLLPTDGDGHMWKYCYRGVFRGKPSSDKHDPACVPVDIYVNPVDS